MSRKRYSNNRNRRSEKSSRVYNIAYGAQLCKSGKTDQLNSILRSSGRAADAGIKAADGYTKKYF